MEQQFSQTNFDQVSQILSFNHACITALVQLLPNMSASGSPLGIISVYWKDRPITFILGVGEDMKELLTVLYNSVEEVEEVEEADDGDGEADGEGEEQKGDVK